MSCFATIHQNWLPDTRKFTHGLKWLRPHAKMMMGNDNKIHLECCLKKWSALPHPGPKHGFVPRYLHMNRNWLNFQGKLFLAFKQSHMNERKMSRGKHEFCVLFTVVCVPNMRAIVTSWSAYPCLEQRRRPAAWKMPWYQLSTGVIYKSVLFLILHVSFRKLLLHNA